MDESLDESGVSGRRAAGGSGALNDEAGEDGVLTLVCLKCGKEYYSSAGDPPSDLTCEKCGSTVFRTFFSHEGEDEVDEDFRDTTGRDLDPDDAEGDTLPGDLLDLDLDRG